MLFNHAWYCGVVVGGAVGAALYRRVWKSLVSCFSKGRKEEAITHPGKVLSATSPFSRRHSSICLAGSCAASSWEHAAVKDVIFWRSAVAGPLFLHRSEVHIRLYFHNRLTGIRCSWPVRTRPKRGAGKHICYPWGANITLNAFTTQTVYLFK